MSEVRRATPKSRGWRENLSSISSEKIADISLHSENIVPIVEDYPYSNQEVVRGEFTYLLHPPRGEPNPIPMEFLFRTESKIFILDPGRRDNLAEQALFELRSLLADNLSISPGSSISRTGVWNFIESAFQVREIDIKLESTDLEVGAERLIHDNNRTVSYERLPPEDVVGKKNVERAELDFQHNGIFRVLYSDNVLSISGNDDQFEYAIQTFEKEAIFNG